MLVFIWTGSLLANSARLMATWLQFQTWVARQVIFVESRVPEKWLLIGQRTLGTELPWWLQYRSPWLNWSDSDYHGFGHHVTDGLSVSPGIHVNHWPSRLSVARFVAPTILIVLAVATVARSAWSAKKPTILSWALRTRMNPFFSHEVPSSDTAVSRC